MVDHRLSHRLGSIQESGRLQQPLKFSSLIWSFYPTNNVVIKNNEEFNIDCVNDKSSKENG